jgi:hypothetical protein
VKRKQQPAELTTTLPLIIPLITTRSGATLAANAMEIVNSLRNESEKLWSTNTPETNQSTPIVH